MARWPGFIGGSYPGTSVVQDCERTINLYVERMEGRGGKSDQALLSVPGYTAWSSGITSIGTRGLVVADGRLFAVIAGRLWEIANNGIGTNRAAVGQDGNPAQMIYNGKVGGQLGICSGGAVYSFNLSTNTLSATALTSGYTHLAYSHGYGLAFNPTTGRVQLSALNDLSSYGGLVFMQRSLFPDPWQTLFVDENSLVWLIGSETFEVRYDSGQGTQPFSVVDGLSGQYGIAAPFAYAVTQYGNAWLALGKGGPRAVLSGGGKPTTISPYAIATALARFRRTATIGNCEALVHADHGHTWVAWSYPSVVGTDIDTPTLVYDLEGQSWTHRGEWNTGTGQYDVWAPRAIADFAGWPVMGDRTTGTIWRLDPTASTDRNGNGIRWVRQSPGLTDEHKRHSIDQVELLMDVGLGTQSGQGSDPHARLSVSADGGQSFGNERSAAIGRVGQYRRRVYWTRLGAPPDAVVRVVGSDPAPTRIVDAYVNNLEQVA